MDSNSLALMLHIPRVSFVLVLVTMATNVSNMTKRNIVQ